MWLKILFINFEQHAEFIITKSMFKYLISKWNYLKWLKVSGRFVNEIYFHLSALHIHKIINSIAIKWNYMRDFNRVPTKAQCKHFVCNLYMRFK